MFFFLYIYITNCITSIRISLGQKEKPEHLGTLEFAYETLYMKKKNYEFKYEIT